MIELGLIEWLINLHATYGTQGKEMEIEWLESLRD